MKTKAEFWDTSALVPLCCQQTASHDLRQRWRRASRVVVWWGAIVEARSAIARLQRDGLLNSADVQQAITRLEAMRLQWHEITASEKVRAQAEILPDAYPLRAMDAFQLAAASVWCNSNPKGRRFVCLDVRLAEAARQAGFSVIP